MTYELNRICVYTCCYHQLFNLDFPYNDYLWLYHIIFFIKTKLATECTNRTIMIIGKKSNAYVIRQGKLIYVNNLKTEVFNIHIYIQERIIIIETTSI